MQHNSFMKWDRSAVKSSISLRVNSLIIGALSLLALLGCADSITPTELAETLAPPSTSAPTLTAPLEFSNDVPTNEPIPLTDIPLTFSTSPIETPSERSSQTFPLPAGTRPHDVAPASDGGVWYTAQGLGALGWLDPETGETRHTLLGAGSRPHGVIVGPDGAPWVTDSGLNAIVRVDPIDRSVEVFPLPPDRPNANLNTATFANDGVLWFTGQNGVYGRFDPSTRQMDVFDSPRGRGPYGIATSPNGDVYFASLAGSYVGRIDLLSGETTILEPPTPNQGARRVWSDSLGRIWVSEWNAGQVAVYEPSTGDWREWKLLALARRPMPSMLTRWTRFGSAISAVTQ